jgi:hypothetical protein
LSINRYVLSTPITSPLLLRASSVLAALVRAVTDAARDQYTALGVDAFGAVARRRLQWAPAAAVGIQAPFGRIAEFEGDPRVRAVRGARVKGAGGFTAPPDQAWPDAGGRPEQMPEPSLEFMQAWPVGESSEYSDGELSRPAQSKVPQGLFG